MKILNLYAGIGGNRKLWGDKHEITAIENNKEIAKIYQDFFSNDKVIVTDAHKYLLEHFKEFDFIWSSPPCQSHTSFSKLRAVSNNIQTGNYLYKAKYPEMELYQEILFLQNYFKGRWVVENVVPYYEPLIKAKKIQRHLFWSNFPLNKIKIDTDNITDGKVLEWEKKLGFEISRYKLNHRKDQILRNCVNPELGLHIFKMAFKDKQEILS